MITWLGQLDLIRLFAFYLALMFLLSTWLRVRQYQTILSLVRCFPGRWPRLFALLRQYRTLFFTWGTLIPALVALGLCVLQTIAWKYVWPNAHLTLTHLFDFWPTVPAIFICGGAMLAFDLYSTWDVGVIDRTETEKYFDQAEYWLRSWTAPVVRFFTLGYVNPRRMVGVEVEKALVAVNQMLNSTLWWVSVQTGLRIAFGVALWLSYALAGEAVGNQ